MQTAHDTKETAYEKNQRFNFLVSWLHSFRYRHMLRFLDMVAHQAVNRRIKIVDIGCAHAKLFSILDKRFTIDYTGIEPNPDLSETARERFGHKTNFRVVQDAAENAVSLMQGVDVVVALETLEHIPEHTVVRIVEAIAAAQPSFFVCSVPVEIGPAVWLKNVGSLLTGYNRHKEYRWVETFWAGLYQLDRLPPHGIHHKGFDWRWLAQTIRHNLNIAKIYRFPFGLLPAALAFSVFIVAQPRARPD